MSISIIRALDNASMTPFQIGENGHMEYSWSEDLMESTLQLHFQLVRGANVQTIMDVFERLIRSIQIMHKENKINHDVFFKHKLLLCKMICQTRDVIDGKGEYMLSYALLAVWNKYYPESAKEILHYFVFPLPCMEVKHPYGSWKDIKNLCTFLQKHCVASNKSLMNHAVTLMNTQLARDLNCFDGISLAAKWVPREKSCHGDLYEMFATHFFNHYMETAHLNSLSLHKARIKAKMNYRKMVSDLNRKLDTVQIKQCDNNWRAINPSNQTSITMKKQSKAFLNLNKDGTVRSHCLDRVICADKFREHIRNLALGRSNVSGKRIGINDFVRSALQLQDRDCYEIDLLNAQWKDNALETDELGKMIAMVDVSGSMEGDPMNAAIGLGIRVAEKSMFGKRIMTFSAVPTWINLNDCNNFVEMVQRVKKADWGMNTNFAAALNMILDAIISQKMKPDDVEDMVLAVFSDMQIDNADPQSNSLMDLIEKKYADAGKRLWGKPFKVPHILFWNLRSTNGFPSLSSQRNVSMMSGFSPSLLNVFCEKGMSGLNSCTPWSLFLSSLDNPRYNFLENFISKSEDN
jgi:hypothetical protein